jgi:predicted aspartyl protease
MPNLHIQYAGKAKDPQGNDVDLPPSQVLLQRGPVVQVTISLGTAMSQILQQAGQSIPPPVSGLALIDTGATTTCINKEAADAMGLPVIDVGKMSSATHVDEPSNIHPIKIEFVGVPITVEVERAMCANLKQFGLLALIGRDLLVHCNLVYNGFAGTITLSA